MSYSFETTYVLDPWENITQNERVWYDGVLREQYTRRAVYSPYTLMKVDLGVPHARTIYFNELIPPRPNIAPIGNREMNASRLYTDAYQKSITTARYGNGVSLHRESEMFNYWQPEGGNTLNDTALRGLIERVMGQVVTDHTDILARNAFLQHPFPMWAGSASGFGNITVADANRLTTDMLDAVWLGMVDQRVPWAAYPQDVDPGEILCITTPGATYDLKREVDTNSNAANKFVNIAQYGDARRLLAGELGTYRDTRFLMSQLGILWNVGTIETQVTIDAAVVPGDGAPDPTTTAVDGIRFVGQPGSTHTITVSATSGFEVGEKVTVHKRRFNTATGLGLTHPKLGVLTGGVGGGGGVDFTDPMAQDMVIYSIPDGTHLVFEEPYMMTDQGVNALKGLETDLGSGVYGYVTKATNIHTAIFLNRQYRQGVISGFAQLPRFYRPIANDDYESIFRLTYDFWSEYKPWDPQVYQVAFLVGSNNHKGAVYTR